MEKGAGIKGRCENESFLWVKFVTLYNEVGLEARLKRRFTLRMLSTLLLLLLLLSD